MHDATINICGKNPIRSKRYYQSLAEGKRSWHIPIYAPYGEATETFRIAGTAKMTVMGRKATPISFSRRDRVSDVVINEHVVNTQLIANMVYVIASAA